MTLLACTIPGKIAAMIEKISVTNFKSHAHTEIVLGRVTALVGPNGAGKSSILLAIQVLGHLANQIAFEGYWGSELLKKYARQESQSTGISAEGEKPQWKVALSVSTALQNGGSYTPTFQYNNEAWESSSPNDLIQRAVRTFGQVMYFRAIAPGVSSPSYTLDIPPQVAQDGSGLASVIAYLMTYLPEQHRLIEENLRAIVPLVKHVRVHPARIMLKEKRTIAANGNSIAYDEDRQVMGHELFFDTASGDGLPASMMSEGTLITLAVLSILYTSDASLIMFDDIEQGLHPLAQRRLIQTIKQFAETHNRQILLTTHSGYIVDELNAQDVWVMNTDQGGISRCKRLSEHQDAERLLQVLTTGEFADAVGEDWVTQAPVVTGAANG